jgi:phytoene dehydrogenase-like protein
LGGAPTAEQEALDSAGSVADHPRESAYDTVVIGGGIGGLTAGALLSKAGKKVLVVEAGAQPGGYAGAIRSGPYTFDRADHLIMGCEEAGPFGQGTVDAVLRHLGVRDRCTFVRIDNPVYVGRFPDLTVSVSHGLQAFVESHLRHFPREAAGLRRLAQLSSDILRELSSAPVKLRPRDLLRLPGRFPNIFRYRNATMSDVFDRELDDPRLKQVCGTLSTWIGPPPHEASFLLWAGMTAAYVEEGAYYCLGSFQTLADAIATGLRRAGGELLLGRRVERILTNGSRVTGVALDDGRRIAASLVISNIDARQTFDELLDPSHVPVRYMRRLRRMSVSPSAAAMYVATDLDVRGIGAAHDTTVYTGWNHERSASPTAEWEIRGFSVLIPTLKDPSLAPPGEHLVILKAFSPPVQDLLSGASDRLGDRMLELAEGVLPDLRKHLTFVYEDRTGASRTQVHALAPVYGWAATPYQTGTRRLPQEGPIGGLLLSGHWTQPGHGVSIVMRSGIGAARLALDASTSMPAVPLQL